MSSAAASLFGSVDARDALGMEATSQVGRAAAMMRRARTLVAADRSGCLPLLTARRVVLAGHLQRYQRFKHGRIFDPVVRYGSPSSMIVARTMKVDCMAMGEVFGAYHARWLRVRAPEWRGYRADMIDTVDMLLVHLEAELRAIRQLLLISDLYDGPGL